MDNDTFSPASATIITRFFALVALKLVHLWDTELSPSFRAVQWPYLPVFPVEQMNVALLGIWESAGNPAGARLVEVLDPLRKWCVLGVLLKTQVCL